MKNYILQILAGVFVLIAVPVTVYLAANPNPVADLRNQASTPTGTMTVSLDPATKTVNVGETFSVNVMISPPEGFTGKISSSQTQLRYNYSGSTSEITVAGITPGTFVVDEVAKTVTMDMVKSDPEGFTPSGPYIQGTIQFRAASPSAGLTVTFNQFLSKIFVIGSGDDVLLTPSAVGNYVVNGVNYHLECRNNTCVKISGAGNDTGGCSVEGRGCLYQHKICVSNACTTQYCSPDSSPCADNCVSNANCAGGSIATPSAKPVVLVQEPTLPVTGTVENTAVILFGGTLLLLLARTLLAF